MQWTIQWIRMMDRGGHCLFLSDAAAGAPRKKDFQYFWSNFLLLDCLSFFSFRVWVFDKSFFSTNKTLSRAATAATPWNKQRAAYLPKLDVDKACWEMWALISQVRLKQSVIFAYRGCSPQSIGKKNFFVYEPNQVFDGWKWRYARVLQGHLIISARFLRHLVTFCAWNPQECVRKQ